MTPSDNDWACKYCRKKFLSERIFMRHECTGMIRAKEIQTPVGQQAYTLYKQWLEKQKRKAPPIETFLTASYYTAFIRFAEFIRQLGIPDAQQYIDVMIDAKISPILWSRQEAYQIYLEFVDKISSPYNQAATTVETILALSEGMEVAPESVFGQLKVGEVVELVHQRRLSPWLLFCSKTFKSWYTALPDGDRTVLMKSLGVHYWAMKLEKSPDVVKALRETADALGI